VLRKLDVFDRVENSNELEEFAFAHALLASFSSEQRATGFFVFLHMLGNVPQS
jgi:hypothetical protein